MIRTAPFTVVVSSLVVVAAGCGGSTKKTTTAPVKVTTKPADKPVKKKPPPPPVCVAQSDLAVIGMSAADDGLVSFCVSDGNGGSPCYSLELDSKKLSKLPSPPIPQSATREPPVSRLQSTPTEVEVCPIEGEGKCVRLKPKGKGENSIEAAINRAGTTVAMLLGDAERGKGVAEVWSVAKKKKLATIKYAKGDYRCGTAHVVDDLVFISAGVCAGPAARGALYSAKGKKVADVGGADFGSYGAVPIEIGDHRWAFLSETAGVIAIHDSQTGKLEKTIELADLWAKVGDGMTGGNPGESVMLRGGDGKLIVITGSPKAGEVGLIDVESGAVEVVSTLACAAAAGDGDAGDRDPGVDGDAGGSDSGDGGSGDGAPEPASDLE